MSGRCIWNESCRRDDETQDSEEIKRVATSFVEGYSDHGFVIGAAELKNLGLNVNELEGEQLDAVWSLHMLNRKRQELIRKKEQEEMDERIRQLPQNSSISHRVLSTLLGMASAHEFARTA
jgi:hypothetical protein